MVTPLEKFLAKHPTPSGMDSKEWAALNAAMKENKFFSSKVENIRLLERLHRLIKNYLTGEKETLPNGETVIKVGSAADFSNQALQWLQTEGLVPPDAEGPKYHNDIKNIGALARLKLIFKTNVRHSIGAAQWEASMKPANLKAWPAFRFIRFPGAKTKRLVHVVNEDAVRLKTDFTFWADEMNAASLGGFEVPWPPFGFNSYMDQEPVSREECERLGLLKPGEPLKRPRGAERFGIDLIERYGYGKKASTAKLPEELKAKLKKVYEDRWGVKQDKSDEVVFPSQEVAKKARETAEKVIKVPSAPIPAPVSAVTHTVSLGDVPKVKMPAPLTDKEADDLLRSVTGEVWAKASRLEKNALFSYTGNGYARINNDLRKGKSNAKAKQIAKVIDRCKVPQDMVVFRGCGVYKELKDALNWKGEEITDELVDMLNLSVVGNPLKDEGFMSAAVAEGKGFMNRPVLFRILLKKKTRAIYAEPFSRFGAGAGKDWDGLSPQTYFSSEDEIIIQKGGTLKFLQFHNQNGKLIIDCELIQ